MEQDGKQGSQSSYPSYNNEFLGRPVFRRATAESEPSFSLESETYRSLGSTIGAPLSLRGMRGGPDSSLVSKQQTTSTSTSGFALPSKAADYSLGSVSKSFGDLEFFAASAYSQPKIQPRAIRDCPVYYEPNSSFLAKCSPDAIFDSILTQLKKQNINYEFDEYKNKIKGEIKEIGDYTSDSDPCTFRIHVFKAPEDNMSSKKAKFLVEVQRRYGCCVLFRRFYQPFLQALTSEGIAISFSTLT